jgi:hypothetical protein
MIDCWFGHVCQPYYGWREFTVHLFTAHSIFPLAERCRNSRNSEFRLNGRLPGNYVVVNIPAFWAVGRQTGDYPGPGGTSGLPLAKIGNASSKKLGDELCAYPRRFRLGGKKEAAGVCRGCGEPMEFQSQPADN